MLTCHFLLSLRNSLRFFSFFCFYFYLLSTLRFFVHSSCCATILSSPLLLPFI
ncbi:unnamed protein product [Meloidogyne enterolobii]|uniref:Uncharacterized protein n=1 Tax=Meloidogyne enterolobii TaxID=390850 RepID=A0ACB0YN87_MELEN